MKENPWYATTVKKFLHELGAVTAIIGAQWGDEGKGKVTDILGEHFDVIARACGGANAGHTIVVGGKKHVFHLLPAGCLHEGKPVILGSGMVIHLGTLLQEIETLKQSGIDIVNRLHISGSAHILFDFHKDIDGVMEERRSNGIGTTRRGIGPAYMDKAGRTGIRMERIADDIEKELEERARLVKEMYGVSIDVARECSEIKRAATLLRSRIVRSLPDLMKEYIEKKKSVLIEGAQATLLDLDHGTYPFVTSSFTTAAGALQGLGMPPKILSSCIGVAKAYCTRVGAGDFPAEDSGERGERLRTRGGEYGSTTGRPRRCGWLSIPDLRYSSFINGLSHLNITKLDVLDEEDTIPVLTSMSKSGKPEFIDLPGWKTSTIGITNAAKLPLHALRYIEFIEKAAGVPVSLIGTGQAREHIIVRS